MKIFIQGKKEIINLDQNCFIASGGEADVYGKDKTVYKIYHDKNKMIPVSKIQELSGLNKDNIINPKNIVLDANNSAVGYTMDWVKSTVPLCKLFTSDFWKQNGITQDIIKDLIKQMQNDIDYIHKNNCLIVDGNELNYLVSDKFTTPYFIDVDSWQTRSR